MKKALLGLVILITAGAMGCMNQPIIPCFDNNDEMCSWNGEFPPGHHHPTEMSGMVCNMAFSVKDACEQFIGKMPSEFPIPDICQMLSDSVGTCQDPGDVGFQCAEGADCLSGNCGEDGLCG
jgi:hypothetical protein